jgi:hypothetical protein
MRIGMKAIGEIQIKKYKKLNWSNLSSEKKVDQNTENKNYQKDDGNLQILFIVGHSIN